MHSNDSPANSSWEFNDDVTSHAGTELSTELDFFAAPPVEIGNVGSAWSTLKTTTKERSTLWRLAVSGMLFLVTTLIGLFILRNLATTMGAFAVVVCCGIGCLVAMAVWLITRFRHICTFVGEHGIARVTVTGHRNNTPRQELLLFASAANLTSSQTNQFTNSVYQGTVYSFQWTDQRGKRMFGITGTHHSQEGWPSEADDYHFANSAEAFWNGHIMARLLDDVESHGFCEFVINKTDRVRVGNGFLEFVTRGNEQRIPSDDIKTLSLNNGWFLIQTKQAKWFGSKGKYTFEYSKLANAPTFVFALERLLDYTIATE